MKPKKARSTPRGKSASRKSGTRHAFTLIELLVVIAIIAILASLLLPALTRAKAKAQSLHCMSNLKELQLSWQMYVHDQDDRLPLNDNTAGSSANWESTKGSWVVGNAQEDLTSRNIEQGTLYSNNKSAAIYHCPSDKSTVDRTKLQRTRSYALNWYLGVTTEIYFDPRIKIRFTSISNPSQVYSFIDEDERAIDDGIFFCPETYQKWGDVPAIRHALNANIAFADGHVDSSKWQFPYKLGSPDDKEDLKWLWNHSP